MCWRTNHVPYSFDFLFWWIDRLYTLSSLQWGFRLLPWLTDILTWHSSVDQFSHRIPSTWELPFFTELCLEAGWQQIHETDGKVSTRSNCQMCSWGFPPLVLSFHGAKQRLNLDDSVGWGDIYLDGAFERWVSCPEAAWHTSHGASLT